MNSNTPFIDVILFSSMWHLLGKTLEIFTFNNLHFSSIIQWRVTNYVRKVYGVNAHHLTYTDSDFINLSLQSIYFHKRAFICLCCSCGWKIMSPLNHCVHPICFYYVRLVRCFYCIRSFYCLLICISQQ